MDSNTSNQWCRSMKADVQTAKLMEVTCAECNFGRFGGGQRLTPKYII